MKLSMYNLQDYPCYADAIKYWAVISVPISPRLATYDEVARIAIEKAKEMAVVVRHFADKPLGFAIVIDDVIIPDVIVDDILIKSVETVALELGAPK